MKKWTIIGIAVVLVVGVILLNLKCACDAVDKAAVRAYTLMPWSGGKLAIQLLREWSNLKPGDSTGVPLPADTVRDPVMEKLLTAERKKADSLQGILEKLFEDNKSIPLLRAAYVALEQRYYYAQLNKFTSVAWDGKTVKMMMYKDGIASYTEEPCWMPFTAVATDVEPRIEDRKRPPQWLLFAKFQGYVFYPSADYELEVAGGVRARFSRLLSLEIGPAYRYVPGQELLDGFGARVTARIN